MKANSFSAALVFAMLSVVAVQVLKFEVPTNTPQETTAPAKSNFSLTFVEGMPVDRVVYIDPKEFQCMALNMYFEARNQGSEAAMAAVGYTVLNRVASKSYPSTICNVVFQGLKAAGGGYRRNLCQFSWVCDGKPDVPNTKHPVEAKAWNMAQNIALKVLNGTIDNPVGNATMYHATYVNPRWASAYVMVAKVKDHIFYEKPVKKHRA